MKGPAGQGDWTGLGEVGWLVPSGAASVLVPLVVVSDAPSHSRKGGCRGCERWETVLCTPAEQGCALSHGLRPQAAGSEQKIGHGVAGRGGPGELARS